MDFIFIFWPSLQGGVRPVKGATGQSPSPPARSTLSGLRGRLTSATPCVDHDNDDRSEENHRGDCQLGGDHLGIDVTVGSRPVRRWIRRCAQSRDADGVQHRETGNLAHRRSMPHPGMPRITGLISIHDTGRFVRS